MYMSTPSILQLKRAIEISEQIEQLNAELSSLLGGSSGITAEVKAPAAVRATKKGKMSAAGRARIAAAQKARWAKVKAVVTTAPAKAPAKKKRKLSPEARARIVAAVKARWARAKKA
ncbi:MAG: hypothetical protein P4L99_15675 [Chthoniobacter sp.]|nr:hypothetical protein [Chthoniobacter sp.]